MTEADIAAGVISHCRAETCKKEELRKIRELFIHSRPSAAALIPSVTTAFLLWFAIQSVRGMDELHRRVHLEALAIAYPLATLLIVTLGLVQLAVGLSMGNWSYRHVAPFLPVLYFAGLAIAWRRYNRKV